MEIPCGRCRTPAPREELHRLGNRLLCPSCLGALDRAVPNREDAASSGGPGRGLLRHALAATGAGFLLRALLFLPLFLWARQSETGAAALKGAVGGDLFGWAVLSILLRPVRRAQLGAGAVVELVLIGLYLQREALFEITADAGTTAVSVLFFFGVLLATTAVRATAHVLEITGVKESG